MDNRARQYCTEQLASNGWVLTSTYFACLVRPDIYGFAQAALALTSQAMAQELKLMQAKPYKVTFDDGNEAMCYSRAAANLAQRIEWIVGVSVREVSTVIDSEPAIHAKPAPSLVDRERAARLVSLRKFAEQELPGHDCPLRGEILNARRTLGMEA